VREESNAAWLRFVMRARGHPRGRARRPAYRHIAGGSDLPAEALRLSVRERLAGGRLFPAGSLSVARRGTGRPCDVCGRVITHDTVERELDGPGEARGLAHEDCYKVWREESRRARGPEI
jgi:hypothetical protein